MTAMSDPLDELEAANTATARRCRDLVASIDRARHEQPLRLAAARKEADEARSRAEIEEPWHHEVSALRAYTRGGKPTGNALPIPNLIAKELFGARLAFDMLDAGSDPDRLDEVKNRYFSMVGGEPGQAFLLFAAALETVAGIVVPMFLDEVEQQGANWEARVLLAEARVKTWSDRVGNHRVPTDETGAGDQ